LARAGSRRRGIARGRDLREGLGGSLRPGFGFPEAPGRVDRRAEVEALVLGLLDQHHGLERVDVVDPLLLALGRNLGLVLPVVQLHLRDPGDLADLTQVELNLVEVLGEVDRLKELNVLAVGHVTSPYGGRPAAFPAFEHTATPLQSGRAAIENYCRNRAVLL